MFSDGTRWCAIFFRNLEEMVSGLVALCVLRPWRSSYAVYCDLDGYCIRVWRLTKIWQEGFIFLCENRRKVGASTWVTPSFFRGATPELLLSYFTFLKLYSFFELSSVTRSCTYWSCAFFRAFFMAFCDVVYLSQSQWLWFAWPSCILEPSVVQVDVCSDCSMTG